MAKPFRGEIKLDVRDSTPDWSAFLPDKAPEGAPNVLVVLYDDTGLAAWSPYGGRIEMPTMQRLADNGLTYLPHHRRGDPRCAVRVTRSAPGRGAGPMRRPDRGATRSDAGLVHRRRGPEPRRHR
ncbi:MAG TPA: hypothetical protein VIQ02_06585, partial [Jiangellaceae bacterium]